ncbi:MAG: ATP-binding cassette domain-containing protein [Actinobacteria bacterium]|nr:ATP-binding cassette domain-containing protein [Actinomycetota bacterium]
MGTVTLSGVSKTYGDGTVAVSNLDLHVDDGEFVVLVGSSGCGKTTSLRMIAGLEAVSSGSIEIAGRDVTELPPRERDIAMVFQSYALYPQMTVAQNMGFPLKMRGVSRREIATRIREAARLLDLENFLEKKPKALSGGQRQRVALGRAIVREPAVFLMDEPLSNLDAALRVKTRAEILKLQRRLGTTTIYVTHDQTEAMTMGDGIAVMRDGAVQQAGTAQDLYTAPANIFVASFIGSPAMNIVSSHALGLDDVRALIGFRPEHVEWRSPGDGDLALEARVEVVEYLGDEQLVHLRLSDVDLVAKVPAESRIRAGTAQTFAIKRAHLRQFDATNGHATDRGAHSFGLAGDDRGGSAGAARLVRTRDVDDERVSDDAVPF